MIKRVLSAVVLFAAVSCTTNEAVITVANDTAYDKVNEIVEYTIENASELVVFDSSNKEIPSQVLHNGDLIFGANVEAGESETYYLRKGERGDYKTVACGRFYPEKMGDLAWENDKIGFRAYGKPYEVAGSTLYGYDLFTKRGCAPVLEEFLYAMETKPENVAKYKSLLKSDPAAAAEYIKTISYHLDHGKGMDYYVVGPTLGCGTSALVSEGKTYYPTYFSTFEILDNGPLRFTLVLNYDPVKIGDDMVSERRTISLDAGTHFNKIEVEYLGLTKPTKVIAGLVLHDAAELHTVSKNAVAYVEPMHDAGWQTYNALLFGDDMTGVVDMFDDARRKSHNGAFGHIQAEGVYQPNGKLTYYMGAGWNGWLFESYQEWFDYVKQMETVLY